MSGGGRINQFRAAVVARLKEAMPKLAHCDEQFGRFDLDELETTTIRAPAVRVAVLQARLPRIASGEADAELSCAAFVVTEGRDRDRVAWTIAEAIATLLHPAQRWGLARLSGPTAVTVQPAVTAKLRQRTVSLIAVEWRQDLRGLGEALFDNDGYLVEGLYLGDDLVAEPEGLPEGGSDE